MLRSRLRSSVMDKKKDERHSACIFAFAPDQTRSSGWQHTVVLYIFDDWPLIHGRHPSIIERGTLQSRIKGEYRSANIPVNIYGMRTK